MPGSPADSERESARRYDRRVCLRWDQPIVQIGKRVLERVAGRRTMFAVGLGCNDARLWRYEGIPGLIYDPTPHGMGAPDEYV